MSSVWSRVSVTASTAPESSMIHCICDSDDEGYTGTLTAPAAQMAKSSRDHS